MGIDIPNNKKDAKPITMTLYSMTGRDKAVENG
jgi:hypothetical protein